MKTELSADEARRIALAAQGFANPRPSARLDRRHLRRVIAQIGLLQIDSVNVLIRSHYMPLFSRLGAYAPEMLDASWLGAPATREGGEQAVRRLRTTPARSGIRTKDIL